MTLADLPDHFRKFAVSTRVSTEEQKDGTSPTVQADLGKSYGESQGWEHIGTFADTISGGTKFEDRPALTQLIELLKRKVITDVIFYSVDRASRDLQVMKELFNQIYLLDGRISIATKHRTYKTYSEAYDDCLFEGFLSQYEKQKIKSRVESGKIYAFENGALVSIPKTGYKIVTNTDSENGRIKNLKRAEIDPVAAEYVNLILDTIIECGTKNGAMRKLNKAGIKTITGKPMRTHVFDDIAKSVMLYAGEPIIETTRVEDKTRTLTRTIRYPAIITLEKAYKIQKILGEMVRQNANPNKPFLGVGYCKSCGKKAFISKSNNALGGYLIMCSTYKNALTQNQRLTEKVHIVSCNHHLSLPPVIDELHNFLLTNYNNEAIEMGNFEIKITAKTIKIVHLENEIKELDKAVTILETEISTMTKAYVANLTNPDFIDINRELNRQVKDKRELVTSTLDKRAEIMKDIQDRKNGLAILGINLSESDLTDIRARCDRSWKVKANKDSQFALIKEIYKRYIMENTQETRGKIQELIKELSVQNWETVNGLMRSIGLTFTVDFSEPDRETRRSSVRVQLSAL